MKMKMIKNNISFCNIILFVGLVTFSAVKNIILLQKKEFSNINLTKLIPKGFTSPLFNINTALYCFSFYVGLLYYIISNIAINTYKTIIAAADSLLLPSWQGLVLLSDNVESKVVNNSKVFLAFSSFSAGNSQENKVLNKRRDLNGQSAGEYITINKNESEIEALKLFREKEMFPGKQKESLPTNLSASSSTEKGGKEWVELKPLLFNYLITKNNQNGIGLDLKNSKLTFMTIKGETNLGNNNYNFNSSVSQSIFNLSNQLSFGGGKETQIVEKKNWYLSEDLIKLISAFFKSIYCLISKPKFINTPDKIIIEILYFITIPDYKIFKWYNFIYNSPTNSNIQGKAVVEGKNLKRRNKSIKLILRKNNLIKKTLFNLNNTNITKLYFNKFIILFKLLNSYFKKPIEFNLIRLHKSNYDSNILAQLFYLILKKKNIRSAIHNLYTKNKFTTTPNPLLNVSGKQGEESNSIPAYISGLYIHIGGRLMREPIIPRKTTKKFEKGAIATGKVNFVDTARITKKNKKGAYTIKIAFAQNFMFAPLQKG